MTAPILRNILLVLEPDSLNGPVDSALALAEAHGARLEAFACVEPVHDLSILARLSGAAPEQMLADAVSRTEARLRDQLATRAPDRDIPLTVRSGKAFLEIIRHVAITGADFVLKSAEPLSGVDRFLYASTDQHLLRKCPCPVWMQPPDSAARPRHVIAAVDLDIQDADEPDTLADLNRRVIDMACAIADPVAGEVTLLHAWDTAGEGIVWAFSGSGGARIAAERYVNEVLQRRQHALRQVLDGLRAEGGTRPRLASRLIRGAAETVIHDQSREAGADVVVMGTVARTGLSGVFIGNTAENIINSLDCAILAVKPGGFVSPLLRG